MQIEFDIEDAGWEDLRLEELTAAAAGAVAAELGLEAALCEISVLACDDARIAGLNADFRGKPAATNVLSWPAEERGAEVEGAVPALPQPDIFGAITLGDLAIARETCLREAVEQGKSAENHVTHLLVHGILHLLGYDHVRDGDAALMEALEVTILAHMGISDPYTL